MTHDIPTTGKYIQYERQTRDYAFYYDGALVGFAKNYRDAETTLDTFVYELLTHTAIESADQAAEVAELAEAETLEKCPVCGLHAVTIIIENGVRHIHCRECGFAIEADVIDTTTTVAAPAIEIHARVAAPPAPVEVLPITSRPIPLSPGAHRLDLDALKDAYVQALRHPEMQTSRWQNALNKAWTHLSDDTGVVSIGAGGGYCWWGVEGEGGSYAPTTGECQCKAAEKGQPCRHIACARIVSFYDPAETNGVRTAYWLVMDEVERMAA